MTLKKLLASMFACALVATPGFADELTEEFVQVNANDVLRSLTAPGVDSADRRVKFQEYIETFTDIDQVAKQNLTRTYASRFTEEEMTEYLQVFQAYALAAYEDYFEQYKGEGIEVLGSVDRGAKRSIVNSKVYGADGEQLEISWFVYKRGDQYLVMDLGLKLEGQMIWLLAEQQAQFKSILGGANGSPRLLIDRIKEMTADLEAKRQDVDAEGNVIDVEAAAEAAPEETAAVETDEASEDVSANAG